MKGDLVLKYDLAETEKEAIMTCSKDLSISLELVGRLENFNQDLHLRIQSADCFRKTSYVELVLIFKI
jgi:hypothetical protein